MDTEGPRDLMLIDCLLCCMQPENVVCTTRRSTDIKLIDFGLAQRVDPDRSVRATFGAPEFCAPEVLTYDHVSFASDMWSLGSLAYVM